jgi:hypothetical protein
LKKEECVTCKKTAEETTLRKCPVCHKHYCDEHVFHYSGRAFCSKHCADYFFFADPDD